MEREPYETMPKSALIARDWLAIDRTRLANERTLLAYLRTAMTTFLIGMSFVHLPYFHPDPELDRDLYTVFGWMLVATSIVVFVVGVYRFETVRRRLNRAGASG